METSPADCFPAAETSVPLAIGGYLRNEGKEDHNLHSRAEHATSSWNPPSCQSGWAGLPNTYATHPAISSRRHHRAGQSRAGLLRTHRNLQRSTITTRTQHIVNPPTPPPHAPSSVMAFNVLGRLNVMVAIPSEISTLTPGFIFKSLQVSVNKVELSYWRWWW